MLLTLTSCEDHKKFQIKKGQVGYIMKKTTIHDLNEIFKNDSIVVHLSEGALGNNYFQDDDEYMIYEKGGKHLLTVIPKEQLDSSSTIKSVQIFDRRFKNLIIIIHELFIKFITLFHLLIRVLAEGLIAALNFLVSFDAAFFIVTRD